MYCNIEDIHIGDTFVLELAPNGDSARYDYHYDGSLIDLGYTGNLSEASVLDIDPITNIITLDCGNFTFGIPFPGHQNYNKSQWKLAGFPIPVEKAPANFSFKECTCGSWKTYGKGFSAHSDWCDIKQ